MTSTFAVKAAAVEQEQDVNPFETAEKFSHEVEELVWQEDISYTEALSLLVEKHQIDYNKVKSMISKTLIQKIESENVKNNVIRQGRIRTNDLTQVLFT